MNLRNRHVGRFSIPLALIRNCPSDAIKILEGMIILKAEANLGNDSIDYVAISHRHFYRRVGEGVEPPWYHPEIIASSGAVRFL